jgi:hypothetical protein
MDEYDRLEAELQKRFDGYVERYSSLVSSVVLSTTSSLVSSVVLSTTSSLVSSVVLSTSSSVVSSVVLLTSSSPVSSVVLSTSSSLVSSVVFRFRNVDYLEHELDEINRLEQERLDES